jgi:hypothetical protein
MPTRTIRHTTLAIAVAALSGLALAQSYGDKPQQPGASSGMPAQTAPGAPMNNGMMDKGSSADTAYQKALAACEQKPAAQQQACREAANARYNKPGSARDDPRDECAGLSGSAKSDCLKNIVPSAGATTTGMTVRPRSSVH